MIIDDLEHGLILLEEDHQSERKKKGKVPSYNPSSASIKIGDKVFGKCLRALVYTLLEYPQPPLEPKSLWAIGMGNWIHEGLQKAFLRAVPDAKTEHEFEIDLGLSRPLRGRLDILMPKEEWAVELKTCYGRALNGVDGIKNRPKPEHLLQVMLYVNALKLKGGEICYVARDNVYRISYSVPFGSVDMSNSGKIYQFTYEGILDRFRQADTFVLSKSLPQRDFQEGDWQCNYCPYEGECR
jgi:hypothetical protein